MGSPFSVQLVSPSNPSHLGFVELSGNKRYSGGSPEDRWYSLFDFFFKHDVV